MKNLDFVSPTTVSVPLERKNIFLCVRQIKYKDFGHFDFLIQALANNECQKTIIYCRMIDRVADIYKYIIHSLRLDQYVDRKPSLKNRKIAMFHRSTAARNKEHVLEEFKKPNSNLSVVVATNAFGMGLDVSDIRLVMFYGVPKSLESFVQQFGRGGRDSLQAAALILKHPITIGCTDEIKEFCNLQECRRNFLSSKFHLQLLPSDFQFEGDNIDSDICCDQCNDITMMEFPWLQHSSNVDQGRMPEYLIKLCLEDIIRQLQSEGFNLGILADDIMSIDDISSASDLVSNFDLPMEVAQIIFDVLRECSY